MNFLWVLLLSMPMNNIAFLHSDVIRYVMGFTYDTTLIARRVCKHWELALSDHALTENYGLEAVDITNNKYIRSMLGIRTKIINFKGCLISEIIKIINMCPELTTISLYTEWGPGIIEVIRIDAPTNSSLSTYLHAMG